MIYIIIQNLRKRLYKMKKKILSLLPALIFVLALVPAAAPSAQAANHDADSVRTLDNAIKNAKSGDTITLTADINYKGSLYIDSKDITIDLNGNTLKIKNEYVALYIEKSTFEIYGGTLNLDGDGFALLVNGRANVTVTGNLKSELFGVSAVDRSNITINGDIRSDNYGVFASGGAKITVNGNVTSSGLTGISCDGSRTEVTVNGNVKADGGYYGIFATDNGIVTVNGNVTGNIVGNPTVTGTINGVPAKTPDLEPEPTPEPEPLADTPNLETASDWARESLTASLAKGFVPADLQNNYQNVITRAEFCRLAVSWLEFKTGKTIDEVLTEKSLSRNPDAFTDTNDPNILAAFALGITSGMGGGLFNPDGGFTREQAAGMILNVGKVNGMDTGEIPPSGFADLDEISAWCVDGVNFCFANGIMRGDNNRFDPKGVYTRQQSIITFHNIP